MAPTSGKAQPVTPNLLAVMAPVASLIKAIKAFITVLCRMASLCDE